MPPISSRTPEGVPNRCPLCGSDLRIEPSDPPGDAPCPNCGHLLWFNSQPQFSEPQISISKRFSLIYAALVLALVLLYGTPFLALVLLLLLELHLTWPEYLILGVLAVLLFCRRLPDVGHYLGRQLIERRFKN